jgi:molybdenum cofactor synthesis domain-containing protein
MNRPARRVAIVTVSDRSFHGAREDASGPEAARIVEGWGHAIVERRLIPDEAGEIVRTLVDLADAAHVDLVLTTGGTGFAPRDVTPEATSLVLEKRTPGLDEAMRADGRGKTPLAVLSRGVSGIRGRTLIINLPGNPKGVRENLETLRPVLAHAIEIMKGENLDHPAGPSSGAAKRPDAAPGSAP